MDGINRMEGIKLLSLFISNLKAIGKSQKIKILKLISESVDLKSMDIDSPGDIASIVKYFFAMDKKTIDDNISQTFSIAENCYSKNIEIITFLDSTYPSLLKEIYDPPVVLYLKGCAEKLALPSISVVGTRSATGKALRAAFETAFYLSLNNIAVISGLAIGIDNEAHKGSISAGGATVAVMGCGLDKIYPVSNRKTAFEIIESGGILISEYQPGINPLKYHFPERNRIISGLSSASIIIQAPKKSGALITADYALDHGRDVFVHEAGLSSPFGDGGMALVSEGAMLFSNPCEIGKYYGFDFSDSYIDNKSFYNNVKNIEDEINGYVVNYKGVSYRRAKYA
ncbi:MAG: DNA-processing protein DprA [Spirochaetaceae bacterium]|nr:DNA-processing protein DprA [Spirochaetaceae bacterium]